MTAPDDINEGLRAPLSDFFEALEETVRSAGAEGEDLTGHDVVLDIVSQYVRPALDQEMQAAGSSGVASWHLLNMTSGLVERAGLPRRGAAATAYQPLVAANKRLKHALTAARRRHEIERATEVENLKELIRAVPGKVSTQLEPDFTTLGTAVQGVPAQVATQLEPDFTTLGTAVQGVPAQVATQLEPDFTTLGNAIQGLPDAISTSLIHGIPQIVKGVIAAIKSPPNGSQQPPVITPVDFPELQDLADASVAAHTQSPDDQINFLAGALQVLKDKGPVPPELLGPIFTVVSGVLTYHDPTAPPLTGPQLNDITDLRQQIATILLEPVLTGR
jgi:hypothetical protein